MNFLKELFTIIIQFFCENVHIFLVIVELERLSYCLGKIFDAM